MKLLDVVVVGAAETTDLGRIDNMSQLQLHADLLRHVNASGFPLQLGLWREVSLGGEWDVVAMEFPWEDPRSGKSGFVDLIVQRPPMCFVIEIKRRTGGAWTFLDLSESGGAEPYPVLLRRPGAGTRSSGGLRRV